MSFFHLSVWQLTLQIISEVKGRNLWLMVKSSICDDIRNCFGIFYSLWSCSHSRGEKERVDIERKDVQAPLPLTFLYNIWYLILKGATVCKQVESKNCTNSTKSRNALQITSQTYFTISMKYIFCKKKRKM